MEKEIVNEKPIHQNCAARHQATGASNSNLIADVVMESAVEARPISGSLGHLQKPRRQRNGEMCWPRGGRGVSKEVLYLETIKEKV